MQLLIVFALSILFTGSIFSQELMVEEIVLQNSTKLIITEENSGKKDSIEIFGWQSYFITNNTLFVVNDGVEIFGSLRYEVSIKEKRLFSIMEYEKQVSIIIYGKCGSFEYAKNDADIFLPSTSTSSECSQ